MTSDLIPEVLWSYAPDFGAYEEAGTPEWLDELDLTPAPPFLKMGTRVVDADDCLRIDQFRGPELALRQRLLDEQHDVVFAASPSADDASLETLELVQRFLGDQGLAESVSATTADSGTRVHPLEVAGRLVQEDLCLMIQRDGDWHLDAAVLCFPSLWSLREKFAQPTHGLHGGVAHYADELSPRVDRFFDRLRPGQAVWRRNLSIKAYPLLFLPQRKAFGTTTEIATASDGSPFWLRTERQTLQRLPRSGAILFTIKLQLAPARVLLARPDRARDLLALYQSLDPELTSYKTAGNPLSDSFLPWLSRLAG